MTMRALMEALKGQAGEAVAVVREGAEAEGETVDAGFEGDGEALEPEEPNAMAEEDLFAGWEEGVPLVAVSDTIAYTEDGEAVEVPADTTAEVVGVALDEDPPGAVIMLDDETMLAIDAEGAVGWAIAEGDEGADLEDEGAQDLEPEEPNGSAADAEPEMEGADPLLASLRAILDEGRKGKKKAAKGKGCTGCDCPGCEACQGKAKGKGKGGRGKAVAEATVVSPNEVAQAGLAYVYASLLVDALGALTEDGEAAAVLAAAGPLVDQAQRFVQRAKAPLRELGLPPSQLQRLNAKVSARTVDLAMRTIDAAE
jgi:hypothetical protein